MQKYVPLVEKNVMELEVFILGGQELIRREDRGLREDREREREREREKTNGLS